MEEHRNEPSNADYSRSIVDIGSCSNVRFRGFVIAVRTVKGESVNFTGDVDECLRRSSASVADASRLRNFRLDRVRYPCGQNRDPARRSDKTDGEIRS